MTPDSKTTPSKLVASGDWFGLCFEIAAQCYGYIACSALAKSDQAVLQLAEDLRDNHELGKLRDELARLSRELALRTAERDGARAARNYYMGASSSLSNVR